MRCVIDDILWIGNASDARNSSILLQKEFNTVIDLAFEESPALLPREMMYLRFPIVDGIGNNMTVLATAIKIVADLLSQTTFKTIVCCSAGLSRSPAIVSAAYSFKNNQTAEESLSFLMKQTTCDISPGLWSEICAARNSITK